MERDTQVLVWVITGGAVLVTIIVLAVVITVLMKVFGRLKAAAAEEARLLRMGTPARAQVTQIQTGGMSVERGVDRRLELVIALQVHSGERAPYAATVKTLVSEIQIPQVQPGAWLQVRVDPADPQRVAVEAFGAGPPGAADVAASVGAGAIVAPVRATGFKLPLGAKIGLVIGLGGALIGIIVAIVVGIWVLGVGGPSQTCKKAAACCRKLGDSAACDNYLKQSGPFAERMCAEALRGYQRLGRCK